MNLYFQKISELLEAKTAFVSVILVDGHGSIPQETGSKMLVTNKGLFWGTVGGGKLEQKAIEEALNILQTKTEAKKTQFVTWNLKNDLGKTCGGSVRLYFESYNTNIWHIVIFGAGHIAHALIPLLLSLDCHITCIDPREEWLSRLPESVKLSRITSCNMPEEVSKLPENAFVVVVTTGHSTDLPIVEELLKNRFCDFPYIGVIGSKAKANRLKKDLAETGLDRTLIDRIYCPVGFPIGSNQPEEIAISITAQLLQERDRLKNISG